MGPEKDEDPGLKDKFEGKAGAKKSEPSESEVPGWIQIVLLAQLMLARILMPKHKPMLPLSVEQMRKGTHRQYGVKEIDLLIEYMRRLKDLSQTQQIIADRMSKAVWQELPDPEYVEAVSKLQKHARECLPNVEHAGPEVLSGAVLAATKLEGTRGTLVTVNKLAPPDMNLPLTEDHRKLVIDISQMASNAVTSFGRTRDSMVVVAKCVSSGHVEIPDFKKIQESVGRHHEELIDMMAGLSQLLIDSAGKGPALASAPKPFP